MKILKSLIKKIDRFVPLKETAVSLLVCSIALILVEFIWDGSVSGLLNMNHLLVAVILLAYLIAVAVMIRYISRFLRIRRRNLGRLRDRVLEEQEGRGDTARIVMKAVLLMLIMLPIIMLTLISIETLWKGSVSYHINLNALIISTIAAEMIAIIAVTVMLYRSRLRTGRPKPRKPAPRTLAPEIRAERAAAGLSTPDVAPAEMMSESEKTKEWIGIARILSILIFIGLLALIVIGSIWNIAISPFISNSYFIISAIVYGTLVIWFNLAKLASKSKDIEEEETDFSQKFPGISRMPIIRWFPRWMYKEGWIYAVGLITIIAIGFILRIWDLGGQSFWVDEVYHARAAEIAMSSGNLASGYDYYSRAPLVTFCTFLSCKALGISEFSARLPSVIVGTICILIIYSLCKSMTKNKGLALFCAFAAALSPWMIGWSREVREYTYLASILILILLFYIKFLNTERKKYIFLFFTSVALAVITNLYILIVIGLISVDLVIRNRHKLLGQSKKRKHIFIFTALCTLALSVLLVDKMGWVFSKDANYPAYFYAQRLFSHELLYIPLFLAGVYFACRKKARFPVLLLSCFIVPFIIISLAPNKTERYMFFIFPLFFIIASYGAFELIRTLKRTNKNRLIVYITSCILLMIPLVQLLSYNIWPQEEKRADYMDTKIAFLEGNLNKEWYIPSLFSNDIRDLSFVHENWKAAIFNLDCIEDDVIITDSPECGKYYLRRYNIYYKVILLHPYKPLQEIKAVVDSNNSKHLYVIAGCRLYTKQEIDPQFREFVLNEMTLIHEYNGLRVYEWENEN